jgi:hypothetical protein
MKEIRNYIVVFVLMPMAFYAQESSVELFSVPLSDPAKPGKVIVEQISGSIHVEAYEGKEVIVKATIEHYEDGQDNAPDGMKRVQGSPVNISAEERNNAIQIVNEQWNKVTNLDIKVPVNFSLKLSTINEGNITVKGVRGELEISNVNGGITLTEVSGTATADTVNGDVRVQFNSVRNDAPMAFSSLNGDLDISFPRSVKANLKMRSDMGGIYTDFEMAVDNPDPVVNTERTGGTYKVKMEQWVYGKINGGGPEMLFKTFNGDIKIHTK